jgi:hypothetical protein
MNQEQTARDNAMWQVAYLKVMGAAPIAFRHRSFHEYQVDLQRQRASIQPSGDPKESFSLRRKTRALVAELGLESVAGKWVPRTIAPEIASSAPEPAPSRTQVHECRRKLSHPDYLAAMKHAARIEDGAVQIYPCAICNGLHVGHNPIRNRLDRVGRKLAEVDDQLIALERERDRLKRWKSALLARHKDLLRVDAEQYEDSPCEAQDETGQVQNELEFNNLTSITLPAC